jgi:hypothetical protein
MTRSTRQQTETQEGRTPCRGSSESAETFPYHRAHRLHGPGDGTAQIPDEYSSRSRAAWVETARIKTSTIALGPPTIRRSVLPTAPSTWNHCSWICATRRCSAVIGMDSRIRLESSSRQRARCEEPRVNLVGAAHIRSIADPGGGAGPAVLIVGEEAVRPSARTAQPGVCGGSHSYHVPLDDLQEAEDRHHPELYAGGRRQVDALRPVLLQTGRSTGHVA